MQLVEYVNSLFEQGLSGEEVIAKTQEWKKKNNYEAPEQVKRQGAAKQTDASASPTETPGASENLESGSGQSQLNPNLDLINRRAENKILDDARENLEKSAGFIVDFNQYGKTLGKDFSLTDTSGETIDTSKVELEPEEPLTRKDIYDQKDFAYDETIVGPEKEIDVDLNLKKETVEAYEQSQGTSDITLSQSEVQKYKIFGPDFDYSQNRSSKTIKFSDFLDLPNVKKESLDLLNKINNPDFFDFTDDQVKEKATEKAYSDYNIIKKEDKNRVYKDANSGQDAIQLTASEAKSLGVYNELTNNGKNLVKPILYDDYLKYALGSDGHKELLALSSGELDFDSKELDEARNELIKDKLNRTMYSEGSENLRFAYSYFNPELKEQKVEEAQLKGIEKLLENDLKSIDKKEKDLMKQVQPLVENVNSLESKVVEAKSIVDDFEDSMFFSPLTPSYKKAVEDYNLAYNNYEVAYGEYVGSSLSTKIKKLNQDSKVLNFRVSRYLDRAKVFNKESEKNSIIEKALGLDYSLWAKASNSLHNTFIKDTKNFLNLSAQFFVNGLNNELTKVGRFNTTLSDASKNLEESMYSYNKNIAAWTDANIAPSLKLDDIGKDKVSFFNYAANSIADQTGTISLGLSYLLTGGASAGLKSGADFATRRAALTAARNRALVQQRIVANTFFAVETGSKIGEMTIEKFDSKKLLNKYNELRLSGKYSEDYLEDAFGDIDDLRRKSNYTFNQMAFTSYAYGAVAKYAEKMGTLKLPSILRNASKVRGIDKVIKTEIYTNNFKTKFLLGARGAIQGLRPLVTKAVPTEQLEEFATLVGHNVLDYYILGENKSFIDGANAEFFTSVGLSSLAMMGPGSMQNVFNTLKSDFRSVDEITTNLKLRNELDQLSINMPNLKGKALLDAKQRKRDILREFAINEVSTIQKLNFLSADQIFKIAEASRMQRDLEAQARLIGQDGSTDKESRDKIAELEAEHKKLRRVKDDLLNTKKREMLTMENKLRDLVGYSTIDVAYNLGLYSMAVDSAAVLMNKDGNFIQVKANDDGDLPTKEQALQQLKDQGYNRSDAESLAEALSKGETNAIQAGNDIIINDAVILRQIASGNSKSEAEYSAISPVEEIFHMNVKAKNLRDENGNLSKEATQAIEDTIKILKENKDTGVISEDDYNDLLDRFSLYKNGKGEVVLKSGERGKAGVDIEEVMAQMNNANILGKINAGQLKKNPTIKMFLNNVISSVMGDSSWMMELRTSNDVLNFLDKFKQRYESKNILVSGEPERESATAFSLAKKDSDTVNKLFEEKGKDGSFEMLELLRPTAVALARRFRNRPNYDEQLLVDEIMTGKRGMLDVINDYAAKVEKGDKVGELSLFLNNSFSTKTGFKRYIEIADRNLGKEFDQSIDDLAGLKEAPVAEATKEAPVEKIAKKPTETVEFSQVQVEKIGAKDKAEVEAKITKATKDSFKDQDIKTFGQTRNVPKAVADIYAGMFGLNPQTITDKTRNYQKTDAEGLTTAKQFLLKNANNDFARLPKTKDGFGKGTFLPRNVMNALYTDGKLTGNLKDYMDLIRQKPVKPIYRDAVGQTIRGLLNLHIRNRMFEDLVPTTPERLRGGAKFSKTKQKSYATRLSLLDELGVDYIIDGDVLVYEGPDSITNEFIGGDSLDVNTLDPEWMGEDFVAGKKPTILGQTIDDYRQVEQYAVDLDRLIVLDQQKGQYGFDQTAPPRRFQMPFFLNLANADNLFDKPYLKNVLDPDSSAKENASRFADYITDERLKEAGVKISNIKFSKTIKSDKGPIKKSILDKIDSIVGGSIKTNSYENRAKAVEYMMDTFYPQLFKIFGPNSLEILKTANIAPSGNVPSAFLKRKQLFISDVNRASKGKDQVLEAINLGILGQLKDIKAKFNELKIEAKIDEDIKTALKGQKTKDLDRNIKTRDQHIKGYKKFMNLWKKLYDSNPELLKGIAYSIYNQNANSHFYRNLAQLIGVETGLKKGKGREEHVYQAGNWAVRTLEALTSNNPNVWKNWVNWSAENYYQESIAAKSEGPNSSESLVDGTYDKNKFTGETIETLKNKDTEHPLLKKALDKAIKTGDFTNVPDVKIRYYNEYITLNPNIVGNNNVTDAQKYNVEVSKDLQNNPDVISMQGELIYKQILTKAGILKGAESVTESKARKLLDNELKLTDQKTKASKRINELMPSEIKYSKTISVQTGVNALAKSDKALNNARRPDAPIKKIRVFDFDDTLARSKSKVLYTVPNVEGGFSEGATKLKAIFMVGGPGAGKTNVGKGLQLGRRGYKVVNQDIALEAMKEESGLPAKESDYNAEQRSLRSKLGAAARKAAVAKFDKYAAAGDGMVIDGTGASYNATTKKIKALEDQGFEVHMVVATTPLETAIARNKARTERSLPDFVVKKTYDQVQESLAKYREDFGDRLYEINTETIEYGKPLPNDFLQQVYAGINANKVGKVDATSFAENYDVLESQGAEFDFREFSKVIEGKKGPLFSVAEKIAAARGTDDVFILTARPADAAGPIQEFMKANGINIPLANITGLGDGTAEAKAGWIMGKAAEGYNDFYFADDAIKNVKAVKNVLSQVDVKSKVQQAKFSKTKMFDKVFNDIIEAKTGIESYKQFSAAKAKTVGSSKGKFTFFTTPSAEDFLGLLYKTLGKGKVGDAQMAFYKTNLLDPYNRAEIALSQAKVSAGRDYKALKKQFKNIPKTLEKETGIARYTYQHAIRTYIWDKQGLEVPGLSKRDQKRLVDFIANDAELSVFADNLITIQKDKPYPEPSKDWTAGTITTDVIGGINKVNRKEYLQEWQENVDIIFSEKNINKLEAAFGAKYVEALKDSLRAMKSGSNRPLGGDRVSDGILDWLNNSVGAIMFLNTRSAVLQTISAVNFVNWGDNNILKAGKAFANQKQFWGDFLTLMNSDYLLERRDGLKINVSESEIADAVQGSKNKVNAAISFLLNKGFVFTRYADSFAIASGGATFYRNRTEALVEQGMDRKAAEEQAFNDFRAIAEENQQSSSPSKISQQQRSLIGRIILQFGNTQLQYVRIQKRAVQDLVNKRGDWRSNVSKIVYYGAIQNLMFNAMQSGLAWALFDDDEEDEKLTEENKEQKLQRTLNGAIDSQLKGLGIQGAVVSGIKNALMTIAEQADKKSPKFEEALDDLLSTAPALGSKIRKLKSAARTVSWNRKEIKEKGFSMDNPAYLAGAQVVSSILNIPLDRAVMKMNNMRNILNPATENWQKVALALGWSGWDVGLPYFGLAEDKPVLTETEKQTQKLFNLNKSDQVKMLLNLGLTKKQIRALTKEEDRVKEIIKLQNKNKDAGSKK